MSDRWEFPVKDVLGKERVLSFGSLNGAVWVSSPSTWKAEGPTYREILRAWTEACDRADRQRGVSPT